ncbi:hypothetical protein [Pseudomonas sp. CBZ-4]|uniref:hypothetical protein n=1 Tax=Pseudomonas sp. CBZ-4 TaxID=1163065 RepID=UPI0003455282|nr:hypothetical protein [Pseudomonas sp. CBZ-4]
MSLLAFLQAKKYSSSGRVHVAPNIPKKLLSNALAAYDLTLDPSDVVVLIDDTMFGSGKDGCLIGHDCLAIRETFSDAVSYAYSEVQSLEIQGSKLFLNKRQAIAFNMPDKADLNQCFSLVLEWMRSQSGDQPSAKRAEVKAAAGSQELSAAQVDAVVQMTVNLAERLGLERVYVRPHIPQKKLQAALESYGANMREDEVLVLIDDTLFGGAKEGVLMGESKLALKMVFEAPRLFFWRHLEGLSVEKRDLYINARKVGSFTQVGEKELGEFFSLIDQALVDARQASADDIPLPESAAPEPVQTEEIFALAVIDDSEASSPSEQQKKAGAKDKLLGYVAVAIEQNKPKILPFLKEKTGEASLAALRDDANVEKLGGFIYAFLPGVVRLALKEETFVRFVLENRNKLLDKLLVGEAERVAALPDITPVNRGYHADLDDLLMDDEPGVRPGQQPIETLGVILQELKQELHDDPEAEFIWQLPIGFLEALLPKAEKLIGFPDKKVEDQVFFALALMYGFSFHKVPEAVRSQEKILESFLNGFGVILSGYEEHNAFSTFNVDDDVMPMLLIMTKVASKQQLNELVRKMLDEHALVAEPGDFEMDDIMSLLREANNGAVAWVDALTRISVDREREVQRKWGDVLN